MVSEPWIGSLVDRMIMKHNEYKYLEDQLISTADNCLDEGLTATAEYIGNGICLFIINEYKVDPLEFFKKHNELGRPLNLDDIKLIVK